jgi:hypothetical protein
MMSPATVSMQLLFEVDGIMVQFPVLPGLVGILLACVSSCLPSNNPNTKIIGMSWLQPVAQSLPGHSEPGHGRFHGWQ